MSRPKSTLGLILCILSAFSSRAHPQSHNLYDQTIYLVKASGCINDPMDRALTGFRVRGQAGIVTTLHGVADCNDITVTSVDGSLQSGPVKIWKVDIKRDLALLQSNAAERSTTDGLEAAPSLTSKPGSKVYVVGYPLGSYLEQTKLPFDVGDPVQYALGQKLDANLREALGKRNSPSLATSVMFLVGPLNPGHSGAPVLDSSNHVLAVADGSIRVSAGYGWAIPFQGIEWSPVNGNPTFQALKRKPSNVALFNWFDTNPDEVQQRITRKLDAIKEDTARILALANQSASKNRLEILRDYVPRIDDKSVRFSERCIALSEAINAMVFRDSAAFEKTAELMHESQGLSVSLEDQRIAFPQLADALAPLAPKYLEFVAREFYAAKNPPKSQPPGLHASTFWWQVFQKAMNDYPELTLGNLSAIRFDEWSYPEFAGLCANLPKNTLVMMEGYPSRSVRGLAALQRAYGSKDDAAAAVPVILELIDADTNDDLQLAAGVLTMAKRQALIDPSIAIKLLQILKDDAPRVSGSLGPGIERESRGREFRFFAAEEYFVWMTEFKTASDVVQAPLVEEAQHYETILRAEESNKPPNGNGDLYAQACIRALISLNSAMFGIRARLEERVAPTVSETLGLVFAHSDDLLWRVNLDHLAQSWHLAILGQRETP